MWIFFVISLTFSSRLEVRSQVQFKLACRCCSVAEFIARLLIQNWASLAILKLWTAIGIVRTANFFQMSEEIAITKTFVLPPSLTLLFVRASLFKSNTPPLKGSNFDWGSSSQRAGDQINGKTRRNRDWRQGPRKSHGSLQFGHLFFQFPSWLLAGCSSNSFFATGDLKERVFPCISNLPKVQIHDARSEGDTKTWWNLIRVLCCSNLKGLF